MSLTYPGPPSVEALSPCDITIHRAEYIAIVGPSGSGKSSLMNLLGLLDRPTTGNYWLDGVNADLLADRDRTTLRSSVIGFVFQAFYLMPHRTACENVEIALMYNGVPRRERRELAEDALVRVNLSHRIDALATQLSGGELQRVAIARAMSVSPNLLLCDEPTGNLDTANSTGVLDAIELAHSDGVTVLVVTHDDEVAAGASRRIYIRDGVVVEE